MPLPLSDLSMTLLPKWFTGVLQEFAPLFSARIWPQVQLLVVGAVLSPGKRTVTAALRVLGLADDPRFGTFHRLLNKSFQFEAKERVRRPPVLTNPGEQRS